MTETATVLYRFAFENLGANRVYIRCVADNTKSAAIPRRLEFVHEATLRNEARDPQGCLHDTMVFAMTSADYARTRG